MDLLKVGATRPRLFTYKVAYDAGTAPNPYGCVCTLAICKPAIRRVAEKGSIVVGLEPGNSGRIVYCMVVTETLTWNEYIKLCTEPSSRKDEPEYAHLRSKIPQTALDQGDCIWTSGSVYTDALESYSGHGGPADFQRDVKSGENVLLSKTFWYFGKGDRYQIAVGDWLPLPGRGHRSRSNDEYPDRFVHYFNASLRDRSIKTSGIHGTPAELDESLEQSRCSRCRAEELENDAYGEEL